MVLFEEKAKHHDRKQRCSGFFEVEARASVVPLPEIFLN